MDFEAELAKFQPSLHIEQAGNSTFRLSALSPGSSAVVGHIDTIFIINGISGNFM